MKINFLHITFVFLVLLIGCDRSEQHLLQTNKTFTKEETTQLLKFLEDFDQVIATIENTGTTDIKTNYHSLFKKLKEQSKEGILNIGIEENVQERLEGYFDKDLSNELWSNMTSLSVNRIEVKDTIFLPFLNAQGKLFRMLENELSLDYPIIKEGVRKINIMGEMSPALIADIIMGYENYNIQDDRVRLFIAIHYLGYNRGNINNANALMALK